MPISLGSLGPDFVLRGWQDDAARDYRLSQQHGHPVVLVFYRGDEHLPAARGLRAYSEHADVLTRDGTALWCIGTQDLHSHRDFARQHDLHVPLLADTGGVVAGMYGVLGATGVRGAVFALDLAGRVRWRWASRWNIGFPRVDRLLRELAKVDLHAV